MREKIVEISAYVMGVVVIATLTILMFWGRDIVPDYPPDNPFLYGFLEGIIRGGDFYKLYFETIISLIP